MTAITYDMQKLDEAVSVLATGSGNLQRAFRMRTYRFCWRVRGE